MQRLVLVMLFFITCPVAAKDILVTFKIPKLVESNTQGVFVEYANKIIAEKNLDLEVWVVPAKRARALFESNQVIGIFPSSPGFVEGISAINSTAFYTKNSYVFYADSSPLAGLDSLKGKKIGLAFGFEYGLSAQRKKEIKLEYIPEDTAGIKMLSLGRIDGFLIEEVSGLAAIKALNLTNISYEKQHPISSLPIFFSFNDTERGKELASHFSDYIQNQPLQAIAE